MIRVFQIFFAAMSILLYKMSEFAHAHSFANRPRRATDVSISMRLYLLNSYFFLSKSIYFLKDY